MLNICRLCANNDEDMINMYDGKGISKKISLKIQEILQITVTKDDTLPHTICITCLDKLDNFSVFVDQCRKVQVQLENLILEGTSEFQAFKNEMKDSEINLTLQENLIEDEKINIKDECGSGIPYFESYDFPILKSSKLCLKSNEMEKSPIFIDSFTENSKFSVCGIDNEKDNVKMKLMKENAAIKNENDDVKEEYSNEIPSFETFNFPVLKSPNLSCFTNDLEEQATLVDPLMSTDQCDLSVNLMHEENFLTKNLNGVGLVVAINSDLSKHREYINERPHQSENYEKESRKCKLLKQAEKDSPDNSLFKCKYCNLTFVLYSAFTNHLEKHSMNRRYFCEICPTDFRHRYELNAHVSRKHSEKNLKCSLCKFVTARNYQLNQHHKEVHAKRFQCEACGKLMGKKSKLLMHFETDHTDQSPITCLYCDLTFTQKYTFRQHLKTHVTNRVCICKYCGSSFEQRHKLILHISKKHGEKNVKCDRCDFTANHKYQLTQHVREVHEKRFQCDLCNKRESKKSRLMIHIQNKHLNQRKYTCYYCGLKYKIKFRFIDHLKKHLP